jgi:hypothetical protein
MSDRGPAKGTPVHHFQITSSSCIMAIQYSSLNFKRLAVKKRQDSWKEAWKTYHHKFNCRRRAYKDRATMLLCCNADGSEKFSLWLWASLKSHVAWKAWSNTSVTTKHLRMRGWLEKYFESGCSAWRGRWPAKQKTFCCSLIGVLHTTTRVSHWSMSISCIYRPTPAATCSRLIKE